MYAFLWRLLPGPWRVKAVLSLILVVGVVAVCFLWLFPAIAPLMPFNNNAVQTGPQTPGPTTTSIP
jgi:hypothetical protein